MATFSKMQTRMLLRQVAAGNEKAFRTLFERYYRKIYSFALYLTHSEIMAEEVTQEIFIKVWTYRTQLQDVQYFNAWIKTLVKNHIYTHLRHLAVEKRVLQEMKYQTGTTVSDTENEQLHKDREMLLKKAIDNLSGQSLIDSILLERRKELAFEGQQLFDLTRNKKTFTKYESEENSITIQYPSNKTILPIPQSEIDVNGNLEQNPGY